MAEESGRNATSNVFISYSRKNKVVLFWDVPAHPLVPTSELINVACAHLTDNMSESEWSVIFPGEDYRPICPGLETAGN